MSHLKNLFSVVVACMGLALSVTTFATSDGLVERIKPIGDVCIAGTECAAAPVVAASGAPRTGEEVYKGSCVNCHGIGAAGAPKFGDAGAWGPRVSQGIETLYTHAINGFNAMPAKGLCMDCSEDEVKASVDYMVENSK